jgi:sulfur carrier protein ThiS
MSSEQAELLCDAVDELEKRDDISHDAENEIRATLEKVKQRLNKTKAKGSPEYAESEWVKQLKLDSVQEYLRRKFRRRARAFDVLRRYRQITDNIYINDEADPDKAMIALIKYGTADELTHLSNALNTYADTKGQFQELTNAINSELAGRHKAVPRSRMNSCRRFLRSALVTAFVLAALFLTNAVTLAAGFDFFGSVAKWSKDAVYFIFGDITEDGQSIEMDKQYYRLHDVLDDLGINVDLPRYIPEGFSFEAIEPDEPDRLSQIIAWFFREDDFFSIRIEPAEGRSSFSEVSVGGQNEIYKERYLITENVNRIGALWYHGVYEIEIQGNLTYKDLIKILDSI